MLFAPTGEPALASLGHPDVATDNTGPFSSHINYEPVCSSLRQGNPPSLRSGTLMSRSEHTGSRIQRP